MKEKKSDEVVKPKTFIHVEIDDNGQINTAFDGNTLVLFGLMEVAKQNLIQRLQPAPPVEPG